MSVSDSASHAGALPSGLILALSLGNFVIGMGAFVVIGVIEPVSQGLAISAATAGGLLTVYAVAYAILSPVLVSMTGRIGRRRVMFSGLAMFGIASAAAALAPDFLTLSATRILAAAGAGIYTPVCAAVVATLAPPERRAQIIAAVFAGLTIAQVVGIPAGSYLAYTFGWRVAFWVVALLAVPCIWAVWTRVPAGLKFDPVALPTLWSTLRSGPTMLAITFTATFLGAIYVLYTYLAPLLSGSMGYQRDGITLILLVFGLGAVAGNIIGGRLADRFGSVSTLLALSLVQMGFLPFFSFLPVSSPLLLTIAFLWSVSGWSFMAAQQLRLVNLTGAQAPVALALNAASVYIGAAIGSAIGAAVIASAGYDALGWVAGIGAGLAAIHIMVSHRISG